MSTLRAEIEGDRIALRGYLGPRTAARCKAVTGARFRPSRDGEPAHWLYPLDAPTCRALRREFGDQLTVGKQLGAWYRSAAAGEQRLAELATHTAAELRHVPELAPFIHDAMARRTYQQVAAAFGSTAGSFALLDQPGLGKTIETLATIIESNPGGGTHLVLCPKVAISLVWSAEIRCWLGDQAVVFELKGDRWFREGTLYTALNTPMGDLAPHVFVIGNIEMARIVGEEYTARDGKIKKRFSTRKGTFERHHADGSTTTHECGPEYPDLFGFEWTTIVADESHRAVIKTVSAPSQTREGFKRLSAARRIALSGTPMRGKPEQLWGTLNWLRPDLYTSYWNWVARYFKLTSNGYSDRIVTGEFRPGGEDALANDIRSITLRRTKGEVLSELPAKQYAGTYLISGDPNSPFGVWLEPNEKQQRQLAQLDKEAAIVFDDGGELLANGILAIDTRRKQLASASMVKGGKPELPSPKYDWLMAKLDELGILDGEGDSKIVVSSQFTALLNLFAERLQRDGVALHLLTGETSESKRVTAVQHFQSEQTETRVFLLNTTAGGVAVTLDAADYLVLLDETFVPDDQEQVEDRIHRTSRLHNVTIFYLRTLGTIQEEIAWVTAAREDVQKYVLDGSRGVEYARSIYEAKAAA